MNMNDINPKWIEMNPEEAIAFFTNLERENAALRAVAMKLIVNNGGLLQLEEQVERDSVDDYIMIKLQDFEALCAAIDTARKEQRKQKIKQMTDAASLDIGHSCLSGDRWMRGDPI